MKVIGLVALVAASASAWAQGPPKHFLPGKKVNPAPTACPPIAAKHASGAPLVSIRWPERDRWLSVDQGGHAYFSKRFNELSAEDVARLRALAGDPQVLASLSEKASSPLAWIEIHGKGQCPAGAACAALVEEGRRLIDKYFAIDAGARQGPRAFHRLEWLDGGFGASFNPAVALCADRVLIYSLRDMAGKTTDSRAALLPQQTFDEIAAYLTSAQLLGFLRQNRCGTVYDAWQQMRLELDDESFDANLLGCQGEPKESLRALVDQLVRAYIAPSGP